MATLKHATRIASGICLACKHGEDCIYPIDREEAVLNCEQFDLCPPLASPPPDPERMELEELWRRSQRDAPGKEFKGLCSNCEERHACIYPKPPEGIWHCEEYR